MAAYGPMIRRTPGTDPLVPAPAGMPRKGRTMATPDAATMRRLRSQGKAMPPKAEGGQPRFPIRNADDLANAIRAVGRVRPNTEDARSKVRRYIIGRAKALGLSAKIPDSWAGDGTLKDGGDSSSSSGSSQSGSTSSSSSKASRVDPDGDGDDDSSPATDTDHDYYSASGKQLKPLPGKPMPAGNGSSADSVAAMTAQLRRKGMNPAAARIFATRAARRKRTPA